MHLSSKNSELDSSTASALEFAMPFVQPSGAGKIHVEPSCQRESRKSMARRKGQRGCVEERGNLWWGKYWIDVPEQNKRVRRSVPIGSVEAMTKTQARQRLVQMLQELGVNTAEHLERSIKPVVTFAQKADKWIQEVEDSHAGDMKYVRVKPSTFRTMKSIVKKHLKPRFADKAIDEISQRDADGLIDELAVEGKSKTTIKNIVVTLGVVLERTFRTKEKIKSLKSIRPAISKPKSSGVPWFTGQQMSAIIGNAEGRTRALLATAAGTGCRAGELFGLRIEDLDFRNGTITVKRSVWEGEEQTPKSENAYRIIGIDASLIGLLKEWVADRKFGYLFPSRNGTPLRVGNFVERDLWPILDDLKFSRCGLHAFRHGRVTVLVEADVPIHTIKAWIGHGSEKMVERYTHHRAEYHQKHLEKVPMVVPMVTPTVEVGAAA
jgi:integrase